MTEPPAPSWPPGLAADPHRRPALVVIATAISGVWCLGVLVLVVRFGLHPSAVEWRHVDPTGQLPHGRWWRIGLTAGYVVWCALGVWLALAAYLRRTWAVVALAISTLLALVLSGSELRDVSDLPVPLGCGTVLVLLSVPATRAWYAAKAR